MDCSTDRLGSRQGQAWNIARHICITHKICTRYEFIYYTAHTSGDCISLRRRLRVASAIGFIFYRLNSYRASRRRGFRLLNVQQECLFLLWNTTSWSECREIPLVFRLFKQFPTAICKCLASFFHCSVRSFCQMSARISADNMTYAWQAQKHWIRIRRTPTRCCRQKRDCATPTHTQCKFTWLKNTFYFPTHISALRFS